jgi:WD40 repeat protein/serine/threonine protein kinase
MESKQCPNCGQPFDPAAARGLCLRCLAKLGTNPLPAPPPNLAAINAPLLPGRIHYFGDYELLEELKRGGMGVVYRARQISLNREVAVKLILAGPFASEDFVQRFRLEAETISQFRHPNIVQIYEAGEHEGQPYFAMEFVPGRTLADLAGRHALPPREAARLMLTVARAVHYVHERGVLHRDLKPTNILLDELGQPRVTDFGVAKRLDQLEGLTLTGQILGTPAFMPPEQISAQHGEVTTRSDVYSLGAVLYFLLSGRPPFLEPSVTGMLKAVSEKDPPPVRQINPNLPPDLETICLQCLAKEPARRYDSAEALARDLERWLAGKPILARPVGLLERQWMWMKRNPVVSVLCVILALSVIVGGAGVVWEWRLSERNLIRAEVVGRELLATTVRIQSQKAEEMFGQHKPHEALALLAADARLDPANRVPVSRLRSALSSRSYAQPLTLPFDDSSALYIAQMSSDGNRIITTDMEKRMRLWNVTTGQPIGPPIELPDKLNLTAFSADGKTLMTLVANDAACLWDAQTGEQQSRFPCRGATEAAALSPNGLMVVVGMTNGQIVTFDRRQPGHEQRRAAHAGRVNWVEFSADGRFLATGSDDHSAKVWDARKGFELVTSVQQSNEVQCANLSPDGARLVTLSDPNSARLWELPSGRPIATLSNADLGVPAVFSPDNARIVLAGSPSAVLLFDAATGRQLLHYDGHAKQILNLGFSPDGQRVASCSTDDTVQIWDVHTGTALSEPIRHEEWATIGQFDPSGQRLMTDSLAGRVHLWDISPRTALASLVRTTGEAVKSAQLSHDTTELFTISHNGAVRVWNARTASLIRTIREGGADFVRSAAFNEGLTKAVLAEGGSNVTFFNLATGVNTAIQVPAKDKIGEVFNFSPDGRRVALAASNTVFVYDAETGTLLLGPLRCISPVEGFDHTIFALSFSPDGRKLAAACNDFIARVWDASNGAVLADFLHQGPVHSVEFSPDGARLLTSAFDNTARIWDLTNTNSPLHIFRHAEVPTGAIFSADGRRALTGTLGNEAFLWNTETGQRVGVAMPHSHLAFPVAFSPSGSEALTREDGFFRRWDAQTGLPLCESYATGLRPLVMPSPNWDFFAAFTGFEDVQVWRETPPALPCPDWLPNLAEGIAGLRYTTNGTEHVPAGDFLALKDSLLRSPGTDSWTQWAKWFLSDVSHRTCSWDSEMTVQSYVDSLLASDRLDDLRLALSFAPTNGLLLARLARRTLEETNNSCRRAEADFLSRRAVEFAPNSAEVAKLRADISSKIPSR